MGTGEGGLLIKSRMVLYWRATTGDAGHTVFGEAEEEPKNLFYYSTELWMDMGSPRKLTVTVEPGDGLNVVEGASPSC